MVNTIRLAWLAAALAGAGCRQLLGLEDGTVVDDTGPDATDPGPDRDGDTVPDATDNCPDRANPEQHDEDGDERGDACDPCPQLAAPAADHDGDGDGLGDGCDPRPAAAGDRLAYWNGFHVASSGLPPELAMVHGSAARWSVGGGALVFVPDGDDWSIPAVDATSASHTADAAFELVSSMPGTSGVAAAGVGVDIAADDADVTECQARTDTSARELWYWDGRNFGGWSLIQNMAAPTANGVYRVVVGRSPVLLTCAATFGTETVTLSSPRASLQRTRAGLYARNVTVRFRYLAIYTSP